MLQKTNTYLIQKTIANTNDNIQSASYIEEIYKNLDNTPINLLGSSLAVVSWSIMIGTIYLTYCGFRLII